MNFQLTVWQRRHEEPSRFSRLRISRDISFFFFYHARNTRVIKKKKKKRKERKILLKQVKGNFEDRRRKWLVSSNNRGITRHVPWTFERCFYSKENLRKFLTGILNCLILVIGRKTMTSCLPKRKKKKEKRSLFRRSKGRVLSPE